VETCCFLFRQEGQQHGISPTHREGTLSDREAQVHGREPEADSEAPVQGRVDDQPRAQAQRVQERRAVPGRQGAELRAGQAQAVPKGGEVRCGVGGGGAPAGAEEVEPGAGESKAAQGGPSEHRGGDDLPVGGQGQGAGRQELAADEAAVTPVPQGLPGGGSQREGGWQEAAEREACRRPGPKRGGTHRGRHGDGQGRAALPVDAGGPQDTQDEDLEAASQAGVGSEQGADQGSQGGKAADEELDAGQRDGVPRVQAAGRRAGHQGVLRAAVSLVGAWDEREHERAD